MQEGLQEAHEEVPAQEADLANKGAETDEEIQIKAEYLHMAKTKNELERKLEAAHEQNDDDLVAKISDEREMLLESIGEFELLNDKQLYKMGMYSCIGTTFDGL